MTGLKNKNITLKNAFSSADVYRKFFIFCTLFSFVIWLVFLFYRGSSSFSLNLFFFRGRDFLADFTNVTGYSSLRDPYNNTMYSGYAEKSYPPLVYVVMYFFSRLVNMKPFYEKNYFGDLYKKPLFIMVYITVIVIVALLTYEIIRRVSDGKNTDKTFLGFSFLLSAPFLFTAERGNCIIIMPVLLTVFLFFRNSSNRFLKEIALICLGLSFGIKLVPAALGLLLIYEKKWLDIVKAVIYGAAALFLPFLFLKGGFANFPLLLRNMSLMTQNYAATEGCTVRAFFEILGIIIYPDIAVIFSALIAIPLLLISFLFRGSWESVLAVTLVIIILPTNSAYYCLLYLIPAAVMFLNDKKHRPIDAVVLLGFTAIFSPALCGLTSMRICNFGLLAVIAGIIAKIPKKISKDFL